MRDTPTQFLIFSILNLAAAAATNNNNSEDKRLHSDDNDGTGPYGTLSALCTVPRGHKAEETKKKRILN